MLSAQAMTLDLVM